MVFISMMVAEKVNISMFHVLFGPRHELQEGSWQQLMAQNIHSHLIYIQQTSVFWGLARQ